MPHRLVLSSLVEYLGAGPSAAGSGIFGLSLSVGVDASVTDAAVGDAARWACPWLWELLSPEAIALAVIDSQRNIRPLAGAQVTLLGVHATGQQPIERATLIARLHARFQCLATSAPDRFVWRGRPETSGEAPGAMSEEIVMEQDGDTPLVSWPFELQAAGQLGAPHAHSLNLSIFFRVTGITGSAAALAAVPRLRLRGLARTATTGLETEGLAEVAPGPTPKADPDFEGMVEWAYEVESGALPAEIEGVYARCVQLAWPAPAPTWWVHTGGVAVRSWRGALASDAARRAGPTALLVGASTVTPGPGAGGALLALRERVVDAAFWLLPAIHRQGDEATRELAAQLRAEAATDPDTLAALLAAVPASALVGPSTSARAAARRATLREAFKRAGVDQTALQEDWAALHVPDGVAALEALRAVADAMTSDSALAEVWAGAVTPAGAGAPAIDVHRLRERLQNRGALVVALHRDLLRAAWERWTAATEAVPAATEFGTMVAAHLAATATSDGVTIAAATLTKVSKLGEKIWSTLTASDAFSVNPTEPFPMTPHPLVVETGKLVSDPGERDGTASARTGKDWADPLRHQLGVALLVRGADDTTWRCPSLGAPVDMVSSGPRFALKPLGAADGTPLDTITEATLTVVAGQQGYCDGFAMNTLTYNARWLGAYGPEELLNSHGLIAPAHNGSEPLWYYAAPPLVPPLAASPWAKIPLLRFARRMELAAFRVSLSGALPPEIREVDNPGALRLGAAPPTWVDRVYRRAVPVSAPRLTNANAGDAAAFAPPALPAQTYPRAPEVPSPGFLDSSERATPPLVLLAARGVGPDDKLIASTNVPERFTIGVRPPAVGDWDTWYYWQDRRPGAPTPDQIAAVKATIVERSIRIHEAITNKQPTQLRPYVLDDPAVTALGFILLELRPDAGGALTWQRIDVHDPEAPNDVAVRTAPIVAMPVSRPPAAGGESDGVWIEGWQAKGMERAATNAGRIPVTFTIGTTASLTPGRTDQRIDRVSATLVAGRLYELLVYALVDGTTASSYWDRKAFDAFVKRTPLPPGTSFGPRSAVSMSRLTVEVATPEWGITPRAGDALGEATYRALRATVQRTHGSRAIDLSATVDVQRYPYVHGAYLDHQRWRWSGRPIDRGVLESVAKQQTDANGWIANPIAEVTEKDGTMLAPVAAWEASEFGDLAETGAILPMEMTLGNAGVGGAATRQFRYLLDLARDESASYHRFAIVLRHRYEGVYALTPLVCRATLPTTAEATALWRWHSLLVKARPSRNPSPVVLRRLIPLLATSSTATDRYRASKSAGFLVLAPDEAFTDGGLAERWEIRVLLASGYQATDVPQASVNPRYPRAHAVSPGDLLKSWEETAALGPFGHTLEPQVQGARVGRFTGHSYVVQPPIPADGSDLPWLMRFRIGRFYDAALTETADDPGLRVGAVDEWVETMWIPLQPDRRRIATGASVDDAYLEVFEGGKRIVLFDAEGRRVGASSVDRSVSGRPAGGVLAADNTVTQVLMVVSEVINEIGGSLTERYVGLFTADKDEWRRMPGPAEALVPLSSDAQVVARLLYLSHAESTSGYTVPTTEDQVWRRILGQDVTETSSPAETGLTELRNRLAYDGMSPPIYQRGRRPDFTNSEC
jgi:hypothetical protein